MSKKDVQFEYVAGTDVIKIKTRGTASNAHRSTKTPDGARRFSLGEMLRIKTHQKATKMAEVCPDSWPRMKPTNRSVSNVTRLQQLDEKTTKMASESRLSVLRQDSVDLVWSNEVLLVGDIISMIRGTWPIIVKVVDGCTNSGRDGALELVTDQV